MRRFVVRAGDWRIVCHTAEAVKHALSILISVAYLDHRVPPPTLHREGDEDVAISTFDIENASD